MRTTVVGVAATVTGSPRSCFRGETFRVASWIIDEWTGEPVNLEPAEHDSVAWLSYRETTTLDLAHAGLAAFLREALG